MKCTNEKCKLKKVVSCRFEEKKSKEQATNLPWMNLSLFSSQLESAEEKPSERIFLRIFKDRDLRPSKKKKTSVSRPHFYKKRERAGAFFLSFPTFLFPIECFLYTLLPSSRDNLEFLGKILIK